MKKRFVFVYTVIFIFVFNIMAGCVSASDIPDFEVAPVAEMINGGNTLELNAKSAVLIDSNTGSILLKKNIHEKLPIASITKIMSMLLIMEAIENGKISFDDMVPVSEHSFSMGGSQVYLEPGEEFTVTEMLKAVAVHSANDATVALAEKVAGTEDTFVAMMNEKAKAIGMKDTNFLDCTGLTDEGHYSTAYDIALMSRELITKYPRIQDFTTIVRDSFRNGEFDLDNTNDLIKFYEGATGLKTGFTSKAGYCLSATAKKGNMELITVVLGEPDKKTRLSEVRKLLDYGFANFESEILNNQGEYAGDISVKKGLKSKVNAVYKDDVKLLIIKGGKDKIIREIKSEEVITAPITKGQKVGEVIYKIGDKEIGKGELVAENDVQKASFIRLFFRMVLEWFGIGRK